MKLPQFFGKKRGHRRTGSQAWGSFGEGFFYAVLLVSGFVFGGLVLSGTVAYSPTDPDTVVLQHGYDWWMWLLTLLLPGALVAFGGSGVARVIRVWGKSDEHRAASMGLPKLLDTMGQAAQDAPGHPGVPTCENLVNSPGTLLRYRLPLESPESWTLIGFGLFAMLWNAVVLVLAVSAGLDLLSGKTDWLLFMVLVPFAAVGVGGIVVFVWTFLLATAVGPTQFEISDHPLAPGGSYDVLLGQAGTGRFRTLEVFLEVEELATFRQGTDTRTERLVVWRERVKEWHDVELTPGGRFESRFMIDIPADAMHSFASAHNSVHWRIVLRGLSESRPAFTRIFPLVVFPPPAPLLRRPVHSAWQVSP